MIPGQWEPRPSDPIRMEEALRRRAVPFTSVPNGHANAGNRQPVGSTQRPRQLATWLEVSIVAVALLATMLLAMWASGVDARVSFDARSPAPLQFAPQVSGGRDL